MKVIKKIIILKNQIPPYYRDEIRSLITTAIAIFSIDAGAQLIQLYEGDLSVSKALLLSFGRSVIKASLTLALPSLFPQRTSAKYLTRVIKK